MNAKNFGVPQNRERVFAISIRKDIDTKDFTFPEPIPLTTRLKDILERNENQVIVSENLSISSMMKNHNFAKIISDCSWYELLRQLQYKADWNNRCYVKIDRFVPSSQMCSNCGYINNKVKNISIRKWTCPNCGVIHDRDINAAINILNEGLRLITKAS